MATPLPANPFMIEAPFVLDVERFLFDLLGSHDLPKVEPLPIEAFRELLVA